MEYIFFDFLSSEECVEFKIMFDSNSQVGKRMGDEASKF